MSLILNCKERTNIYPTIVERGELVTGLGVTCSSLENRNNVPDVWFATCVRGLETAEHGGIAEAGDRGTRAVWLFVQGEEGAAFMCP